MANTSVCFAGLTFNNPVVTVSGTFGFGVEYGEMYDLSNIGGICVKGLTRHPRLGNPPPRIAETPMGIINSVGLQNPGVEAFIKDELPRLKKCGTRIIANISGNTVEEYAEMAEMLSDAGVDMIEANVSCPNVKSGGLAFGTTCEGVSSVTSAVKKHSSVPIIVKLSPNVTDICEIAHSAEAEGADGLSLINTILGMRIDINSRRPVLRNNTGGLSGPAVLPVAVRMVWQVANAVKIPLIGMGGISSWQDAVEMMLAGATLVGVGTAMFRDPFAPVKIAEGISKYMDDNSIPDLSQIIGGVITY